MQKLFFYQFTVSDEEEDSNALQKPLKALFLQSKTVLLIENPMLRGHMSLFIFFGWLKRRFKGKVAPKSTLKIVPNLYKCLCQWGQRFVWLPTVFQISSFVFSQAMRFISQLDGE